MKTRQNIGCFGASSIAASIRKERMRLLLVRILSPTQELVEQVAQAAVIAGGRRLRLGIRTGARLRAAAAQELVKQATQFIALIAGGRRLRLGIRTGARL